MSISNKKEILELIINKKLIIENNYFAISKIITDILNNTKDKDIIKLAQDKQLALDNAINFAISELEILIQNFIESLQSGDIERHKQIEREMQQKIDELNLKTQELTKDLSKVSIVNNPSGSNSQNEIYGTFDKATEKDVNNLFGKKAVNEIKDLREGVLIDSLNTPSPRELSIFDDIYFDEVAAYNEYKNNKDDVLISKNLKNEFVQLDGYSTTDQIDDVEKRLVNEINDLKIENKLISDTNKTILSKIEKSNKNILDTNLVDTKSIDMLDVAINNMISKIELTKFPDVSKEYEINYKNLENIGQTLIKSLENNLEALSKDVEILKNENNEYRNQITNYVNTINNLKNERLVKEQELNESYMAWVSSNRKLQDLETLLDQQSVDLDDLDGQKNIIIDSLEKKLKDTINNLNEVLIQNEELINRQEELEEFIRVNDIKNDYGVSAFDQEIEAKSLQDLVEHEANRIVDKKMTSMLSKYKEELEFLENKVRENIEGINTNKDILTYEFEKKNDNSEYINELQEKIKKFENKISKLENKIQETIATESKTRETINSLNELLEYDQIKEEVMESEVGQKLKSLEKMINETVDKINYYESSNYSHPYPETIQKELSPSEVEDLIKSSDLYSGIKAELIRLENQVNNLKTENIKIKKENFEINNELDDSLQKFTYNTMKMKQVEELLNTQTEELERLNYEKDELINALEGKVKETTETNNIYLDELSKYQEAYDKDFDLELDNNENYENNYEEEYSREKIELLIDKRVNELLADKALNLLAKQHKENYEIIDNVYENDVHNDKYTSDSLLQEDNSNNYDDSFDIIPVEQSFESNGFNEEIILKEKDDEIHLINDLEINDKNISNIDSKENENYEKIDDKTLLIHEIERLKKEYNNLLSKQSSSKEQIIKEKVIIKEIETNKKKIPLELLESTERLKNFEKLLMQIDNEISNLENDSLNKFIDNQI